MSKHKFNKSEFEEITQKIEILLKLVNAETRRLSEPEIIRDKEDLDRLLETLKALYWKMREQIF